MIELTEINKYLQQTLSEKRYKHSVQAAETAKKLALSFGADANKAYIAGLVHDCTRETELAVQRSMLETLGISVDSMTYQASELLHAYSAEYVLRNEFKINDEEIITAVRSHTTGRENMTILDKVIFLSDVIEPSRSFPGIESIRQHSKSNLDEALMAAFDSSIRFLLEKKSLIHPNTFYARNYILEALQK
ncbi:MAG: hypothetical protein K0R84_2060 [Clostridia bacterium]|nr:hypothetical protein [Clostridia bacterium]